MQIYEWGRWMSHSFRSQSAEVLGGSKRHQTHCAIAYANKHTFAHSRHSHRGRMGTSWGKTCQNGVAGVRRQHTFEEALGYQCGCVTLAFWSSLRGNLRKKRLICQRFQRPFQATEDMSWINSHGQPSMNNKHCCWYVDNATLYRCDIMTLQNFANSQIWHWTWKMLLLT